MSRVVSFSSKVSAAIELFFTQLKSLRKYFDDPDVQEIMINGPGSVWVEACGRMERVGVEVSDVQTSGALKAMASANFRDVSAVFDARTQGVRLAAALYPVAVHGNAICIRKHTRSLRTLGMYLEDGLFGVVGGGGIEESGRPLDGDIAAGGAGLLEYFRWVVRSRKNVIVVGGTGSGKTTFINALLQEIPKWERVLTIEDTAELILEHPNYVSFEVAESRDGDRVEVIDIRRLVRLALRFRPDRIIVGEIRGAEAYDMIDAMNTGHQGGICSLHADSAVQGLYRLENMLRMHPNAANLGVEVLRRQIAQTINVVIYCSRSGGVRRPVEVVEVLGVSDSGEYRARTVFSLQREN